MSRSKELESLIEEYSSMGFDAQDICMAWLSTNQRKPLVLDYLLSKNMNKGGDLTNTRRLDDKLSQTQVFEEEMQTAISRSIEENDKSLKPDQLLRTHNSLAGLKNIGNTCYFNSLIQTLFQIEDFVKTILSFYPPYDVQKVLAEMNITDAVVVQRKKDCVNLVLALQKLFVMMLYSNKNVLDPSDAMESIVDGHGKKNVKVGEQSDISEFSINFFERIEEGLTLDARPKSDEEHKNKSIEISNLFFGKAKDFITFEWSEFKTKKNQDSVFGPINLNISHGDLMSALEGYTNFSVEGYQTPNGEVTTAKKRVWILTPPNVLTFVLQRVEYDREKGLVKVNDYFNFPKEMYLDRFLYDHKKEMNHMIEERKILKAKEKKIDHEINQLLQFKNTNLPIKDILEATGSFLTHQIEDMEKDFVEVDNDSCEEKLEECSTPAELRKFCEVLQGYKESVAKKLSKLEKEKEYIKKKIETSFQDLQKMKYALHSIVVHEGGPMSGHYYSYIYDKKENKWRKYNDSKIVEVSEEEVFQTSLGGVTDGPGGKNACAYCLFYVKDDCKVMDFSEKEIEGHKRLLSKEMLSFVDNENANFLIEFQHYNSNMVQKIYDEYIASMKIIGAEAVRFQGEYKNEYKNSPFPFAPSLPNFNSFLMLEVPKCSEITRWNVLKAILLSKKVPYKVLEGEKKNHYYFELRELIVNQPGGSYPLKELELSESNKDLLEAKKKEFVAMTKCVAIIRWIFGLIMDKKWKEAMVTTSLLHEKLNELKISQDYVLPFTSFSRYLLALLCFRFCALIDMNNSKMNTKEALNLLEIMIYTLNRKQTIKLPNIFYQQICSNLHYSVNSIARNNPKEPDSLVLFTHHIQKIEDKREFLPSFDITTLISTDLLATLAALSGNDSLFYVLEKKNPYELQTQYQKVCNERLQLWCEIEEHIRKKNVLFDQEQRIDKETVTWFEE